MTLPDDTALKAALAAYEGDAAAAIAAERAKEDADETLIASLQAQLAEQAHPTLWGASVGAATQAVAESTMGPFGIGRSYDNNHGPQFMLNLAQDSFDIGTIPAVLISFHADPDALVSGGFDAQLDAVANASYGKTQAEICYYHEIDAHTESTGKQTTIAKWKTGVQYVVKRLRAAQNPNIRTRLILTGYQFPARFPLYYIPSIFDGVSVDPYAHSDSDTASSLMAPIFSTVAQYAPGLAVGIGEIGRSKATDAQNATLVESLAALRGKIDHACWFNTNPSGDSYQINNLPLASAAFKALPR